jgi:hypothetical protein
VVIAESTRRLVGNLFELEDLGAKNLKGISGPVRAWAALRPSSVEGRFEAFHASGLTDLVGREEELEILLRVGRRRKVAKAMVLLSGEAGIGKSRLTAALLERIAVKPHRRLRYFCSPQHTDSAFYPIIGQMERAAGFEGLTNAQQDDFVNPVELVGFTRRKAQRNVDPGGGGTVLLGPSPGVAAHSIVAAIIATSAQFLEQPD